MRTLGESVIVLWSIILCVSFGFDLLQLSPYVWAATIGFGATGLCIETFSRKRDRPFGEFLNEKARQFATLILVWVATVVILLVPLLCLFPTDTLVTGNFVCNDSVVHAITADGFAAKLWRNLPAPYLNASPHGFPSLLYFLNQLSFKAEAPFFLLAGAIWATSFTAASLSCLLGEDRSFLRQCVTAVSAVSGHLTVISIYLFFFNQVAVLPTMYAAVGILLREEFSRPNAWTVFSLIVLLGASMAVYSLLPVSLIVFGAVCRLFFISFPMRRQMWRAAVTIVREYFSLKIFAVVVCGVIFCLPGAWIVFHMLVNQGGNNAGSDLLSSVGNLAGGYLDPLLVTGFWTPKVGYRDMPTGAFSVILAACFAAQVFIIARYQTHRPVLLALLVFSVPVLATAVVIKNQYINFKYLSFLTALWLPVVVDTAYEVIERLKWLSVKRFAAGSVPALLATGFWFHIQGVTEFPALPAFWFQSLSGLRRDDLSKVSSLMLTREDWLQYYRTKGEILPLTLYLADPYSGQRVDRIVIDKGWQKDAYEYLEKTFPGSVERIAACPMREVANRYDFYSFDCVTGLKNLSSLNGKS